jgi:alkane 1-monooxygenase
MKDLKYLIAYIGPLSAWAGLSLGGWWSFGVTYIAFGLIPFLELILPFSTTNHKANEEDIRVNNPYFDWILYAHVPIMYLILAFAFQKVQSETMSPLEIVGTIFNMGVLAGSFGINIGHELGHRAKGYEQSMAKLLLLPTLYQHFYVEHNRGHHKNVATDADPASARLGENVYAFWWRSVKNSYINAWHLEIERLQKEGKPKFSLANDMIRFTAYQLTYLIGVSILFGYFSLLMAIAIAIVGFLLLETVNYIEHYGLRRALLPSGRYEPVMPIHSWNSDHEIGRIFLYELTRHSDHHYKATRKYQILRHFDESPQLPFGYPLSMLISLVPPIWFGIMNKRIPNNNI